MCPFPEWEDRGYTPAVFVRVAKKGVRAYGKWKSAQAFENKAEKSGLTRQTAGGSGRGRAAGAHEAGLKENSFNILLAMYTTPG